MLVSFLESIEWLTFQTETEEKTSWCIVWFWSAAHSLGFSIKFGLHWQTFQRDRDEHALDKKTCHWSCCRACLCSLAGSQISQFDLKDFRAACECFDWIRTSPTQKQLRHAKYISGLWNHDESCLSSLFSHPFIGMLWNLFCIHTFLSPWMYWLCWGERVIANSVHFREWRPVLKGVSFKVSLDELRWKYQMMCEHWKQLLSWIVNVKKRFAFDFGLQQVQINFWELNFWSMLETCAATSATSQVVLDSDLFWHHMLVQSI